MPIRLRKLVVSLIVWVFDHARGLLRRVFGKKSPSTCVILYYHAITPKQRAKFARQMDYLIRSVTPIFLDQIGVLPNGGHYAAVTFDDGFSSVIENALPELELRKIPATIFIPTAYLGQKPSWPMDEADPDRRERVMTADQIRAVGSQTLVSIGSHCRTHTELLVLKEEDAKNEIFGSKGELEQLLGKKVKALGFPYGAHTPAHVAWAREAGYDRAFTTWYELLESDTDDYVMARTGVDPGDWLLEFHLKLVGAYRRRPRPARTGIRKDGDKSS